MFRIKANRMLMVSRRMLEGALYNILNFSSKKLL